VDKSFLFHCFEKTPTIAQIMQWYTGIPGGVASVITITKMTYYIAS
jgi:hypothetical protein